MRYILLCLCLALTGCSTAMVDEIFGNRYERVEYVDQVVIMWINSTPLMCGGKTKGVEGCAYVDVVPLASLANTERRNGRLWAIPGKYAETQTRPLKVCNIDQPNKVEHVDRIDWIKLAEDMQKCFDTPKGVVWDVALVNWKDTPPRMWDRTRGCTIWVSKDRPDYLTIAEEFLHCFGWHHEKGYELQWRGKTLEEDRKDWVEKTRPSADEGLLPR